MQPGHVSLPNGYGLDDGTSGRRAQRADVGDWRDPFAGTPWHKHVPAKITPTVEFRSDVETNSTLTVL